MHYGNGNVLYNNENKEINTPLATTHTPTTTTNKKKKKINTPPPPPPPLKNNYNKNLRSRSFHTFVTEGVLTFWKQLLKHRSE